MHDFCSALINFYFIQDKVLIVKTNADKDGREFGSKYDVKGFPSRLLHKPILNV
jgi:hypothetical protein